MKSKTSTVVIILVILAGAAFFFLRGDQFELPKGETVPLDPEELTAGTQDEGDVAKSAEELGESAAPLESAEENKSTLPTGSKEHFVSKSSRQIFVTAAIKHSITIDQILSGGPLKDWIPSFNNPYVT